jgi:Cellulase (glycosyl hydrolase family 5)
MEVVRLRHATTDRCTSCHLSRARSSGFTNFLSTGFPFSSALASHWLLDEDCNEALRFISHYLATLPLKDLGMVASHTQTVGLSTATGCALLRPRSTDNSWMQNHRAVVITFALCSACSTAGSDRAGGASDAGTAGSVGGGAGGAGGNLISAGGGLSGSGGIIGSSGGGVGGSSGGTPSGGVGGSSGGSPGGGVGGSNGGNANGGASGKATRPSYNTGTGFFVLNGDLYDANGNEFRLRGVDRNHYDSDSAAGIAKSKANAVRIFVETNYGQTWAGLAKIVQTDHIGNNEVPIITAPSTTAGTATSCNTDAATLTDVVANSWVASASTWTALDKYSIVNIANEWGPSNSTVWRDSYIAAIASMRAAGYLGTLLIDAGGCGQDINDLVSYSSAVFNSDPQRNIMFALHLYGSVNDYNAPIASIAKGNPTVVTLTSTSLCHPFAPSYCPSLGASNTYSGLTSYELSGVQGMTAINGTQASPQSVGGSSGAWTVTLNVDSTSFGAYAGGGTIVDHNGNYALLIPRLAALRGSTGAAFALTEFGPGKNIGPSPTLVTPLEIISTAETNNLGWLAWAWDDNDADGGHTDNEWFGMTYNGSGTYSTDADLTMFGQQIVLGCTNPAPGGCGCPDGLPLPAYFDSNNPTAATPAIYSVIEPACKGTRAPVYQPLSLQLATRATVF